MCVALPGRVLEVADGTAIVEMTGRSIRASTVLYPKARPGQWVLVATGLVTGRISAREAREIEALYREGRERP
jgi:hydrogenase assembly chaperone HypC/HupF